MNLVNLIARSLAYASLLGPWSIKMVNELDRCSKDTRNMRLTYPDRISPCPALLGTLTTIPARTGFKSIAPAPPARAKYNYLSDTL
ncbi:MAG: hypothetical protein NTW21_39955 [Verrucomicrobia bacterium]|nr:hypothetical protein [Verrucomicrobiota bacterium]